jgi:isopenicillin N synthase-like dioxygenase
MNLPVLSLLSYRLLEMIAMSLDLPQDWFDDKFDRPMTALRPLHYSGRLSDASKGIFAAGRSRNRAQKIMLLFNIAS